MAGFFQVAVILVVACWTVNANYKLNTRFEWKELDFEYPSENDRSMAIKNGEYIPRNNLPLGVERWKNKLFVTCPRWKDGTAATLSYIDLETKEKSPKLKPYPNWEAHKLRERNGVAKIVSVFRLYVDVCDRLWLVDTGLSGIVDKKEQLYGPKIQVYDLNTDTQLREYVLPKDVLQADSFLANIIADVTKDTCDKAFAYVADITANALIVYDMQHDVSHKVTHHYFSFDPLSGDFTIGGINFQWNDGIFGLALSPVQPDGFRTLYFHPMSTTREFAVSTRIIRNNATASSSYHEYKVLGSRGPNTQSSGSSIDEATGVLVYTLLNKNGIGCWNSHNPEYSADTNALIASDDVTMIFPNDLKVDQNGTIWVVSDKIPNYIYGELNFSDVNYRILSAPVSEAIKGTVCDKPSSSSRAIATNMIAYAALAILVMYVRN